MKCAVEKTSIFFCSEIVGKSEISVSRKFVLQERLDLFDCCCGSIKMIKSILVINTSGKARLLKFYEHKVLLGGYLLMKF